uniref:Transposase MuDR plant domain-containing protein n=1 Tax=Chenopodium quinoa TaxID=63459 RepID=A0A803M9B6_CHEQI
MRENLGWSAAAGVGTLERNTATGDNNPQVEGVNETIGDEIIQATNERGHLAGENGKWPIYWTTFEGGYESDQRDLDNEDPLSFSEDEDKNDTHVQKRRKKVVYPTFNDKIDMKNVELFVRLRFASRDIFKEAILAYSIQQHKDLVYLKNDKRFISVGCANCRWEITSSLDLEDHTRWQIKSMQPVHEWCTRTFENKLITMDWLAKEYFDKILRNPLIKAAEIKADMRARYDIVVSIRQCQRAKGIALNAVQSLMNKQYGI